MRRIQIITALLLSAGLPGCATWGTHVKTAGTLAEHLHAECGALDRDAQEQCIANELAAWAECAAQDGPDEEAAPEEAEAE